MFIQLGLSLPLSWLFDSEALSSVSVESSISELNKALGEGRRVGVDGGSCFGGNSGLFSFPSLAGWNSWFTFTVLILVRLIVMF